tara:strand:+ start:604 stop:711 length:108 start_codon:yes stop_codon:yes gene_type:complete
MLDSIGVLDAHELAKITSSKDIADIRNITAGMENI